MAEQAEESGLSQRAAAMAAFQKHSSENSELGTHKESSAMTQREKAMAALNHKGVVNQREMKGLKGETQHAQAMKNLKIDDQPAKVVPNWKQTAAQKTANAVRKEIGSGASSARAMFQKQETPAEAPKPTVAKPAKSFVPVATTTPVKRTSSSQPGQPPSLASPVSSSVSINTASEAELMVDHDLSLLVAGIKRLVAEGKGTQDEVRETALVDDYLRDKLTEIHPS